MKVNPEDLARLLSVQGDDSAVDSLKHKVSTLPIHATIAALKQRRTEVADRLTASQTELGDVELAAERAEADVVPVRERLIRNQARVDAGAMDPKALSNAIDEIAHLKQRISDLEDTQLEAMDVLEMTSAQVASLGEEVKEVEAELHAAVDARDAEVGQLASQARGFQATRAQTASAIAPEVLTLYEKIRARSGGVGVARLEGRRCSGCGLEATVTDFNRYTAAPPDELLRCSECDRILVRRAL
ncbi:MAG: hypothetical protein LBN10_02340 [Propionibacteriaceae bacterium]|jgi:predicted  nucleic acid-binding Zn-ribbon protein|nr:hypothetical protein [Propionibacteriaceae bacterium]